MKWSLLAVLVLAGCTVSPVRNSRRTLAVAAPTSLRLVWDYDPLELSNNLVFNVYATSNLLNTITNWPLLVKVPGTNTFVDVSFPAEVRSQFFIVTASNMITHLESPKKKPY